jgi:hypothetical protein
MVSSMVVFEPLLIVTDLIGNFQSARAQGFGVNQSIVVLDE